MKKNYMLWTGIAGTLLFTLLAVIGPYLPGIDRELTARSYYPDFFTFPPIPPSSEFWLGLDREGRDVLSYLVIGTRHTLLTVLGISLTVFILAMAAGLAAAHSSLFRSLLDGWNYLFSRVPVLFMVIFFSLLPIFLFSPHRHLMMMGLIILFETGKVADIVKNSMLQVQKTAYYEAAKVLGTGIKGLWTGYYWPVNSPQWLSYFFTHLGSMLFLIGQLGVFNIFLSMDTFKIGYDTYEIINTSVEWPLYISNILTDIDGAPWIPFSAALFIGGAMFSFYSLGEGLRKRGRLQ